MPEKAVLPQTHLIRYAPKTQDTWLVLSEMVSFKDPLTQMFRKEFFLCVSLMQNRMEIFSTAPKLFVWRLRLRAQNVQSPHYWQMGGKNLKSVNHYKYLGAALNTELSDDKDIQRQLRLKYCAKKQAASLFFPMFKCSQKCTNPFLLYAHVCITNMVEFQKVMHAKIACGL